MMKSVVLIGIAVGIAALGYGYSSVLDTTPRGSDHTDTALVESGKKVYDGYCAHCHGFGLEGAANWRTKNADGSLPPPPHDATGHTWHHPDELLFKIVREGGQSVAPADFNSTMPDFGGRLSDVEIWAVLSFIKSRWPANIQDRHTEMSKQAR